MNNMNAIPDYSKVENFNLAALEAVTKAKASHKIGEKTGEAIYYYKGRTLKVSYDAFLNEDGSLDSVGISSIESIKGE